MKSTIQKQRAPHLWLLAFVLVLVACAPPGGSVDQLQNTQVGPQPSATPTQIPGIVFLFASTASDPQLLAEAELLIQSHAAQQNLIYEKRETLSAAELPAELDLLVIIGPHEGLAELAAAAPQVRIIGIELTEQLDVANVQLISLGAQRAQQAAFISGYTAALSTEDWRVGALHAPQSLNLAQAFLSGVEFFCGSCAPVRPPYNEYPQAAQVESAQNWQAGADLLIGLSVESVYLTPELELPEVQQYLVDRGILLIGSHLTSPEFSSAWLATVSTDSLAALRQQLPQALAELPLSSDLSALELTEVNEAYLSEARLRHIDQVISDLLNGFIALPSAE